MNDKPFTVNDRRHFTPEGQAREEEPAARPDTPVSPTPTVPEGKEPAKAAPRAASAPPLKADLTSLLLSLATQAGLLLEGRGLPEGTPAAEGLAGAQSIIAILEMLQEKTEGRRTAEETEILENVLYELRMAFVAKSRVAGA